MMAGIASAEADNETIIIEKMDSLGKKLRITGKGRCNITNAIDIEEFIKNIPGNGKFLYSAFQNYTNKDIIDLLKEEKINVKVERGNRVFPTTDNAQDVINALISKLKQVGVKIITNAKVTDLEIEDNRIIGVKYLNNGTEKNILADKAILATGGVSYPNTGSSRRWTKIS